MKELSRLILMGAMLAGVNAAFGNEDYITAELGPARNAYIVGEPIELLLRIHNGSGDAADVVGSYPSFTFSARSGIELRVAVTPPTRVQQHPSEPGPWISGGLVPGIRIEPGASWEIRVFLQRYMLAPGLGQ